MGWLSRVTKNVAKNVMTTSQMIGSLTREALDATYDDIELKAKAEVLGRQMAEALERQVQQDKHLAELQMRQTQKMQMAAQLRGLGQGAGPLQALQVLNQLPSGLYHAQALQQAQALLNQMPSPQQYTAAVTTGTFVPYQPSPTATGTTGGRRIEEYDYATGRVMVRDENGSYYYDTAVETASRLRQNRDGLEAVREARKAQIEAQKAKELHGARMKLLHTLRWVHDIKELEEPW